MKKRELVMGAIALTGTVAGMLNPQVAFANLSCTDATSAATSLTCTGSTGGYLAEAFNFTGSNGVKMAVGDSTALVSLCGAHMNGTAAYGLTTDGGSMETKDGSGSAVTPSTGSGGCA